MKKLFGFLRAIFGFAGAASPILDELRTLFPNLRQLGDINAKLDRVLEGRAQARELLADIDTTLAQDDIPPRVRALLTKLRTGLVSFA